MTVTFADKLARMPHYEAGLTIEEARESAATGDVVKLASNESPFGPQPAVVEAIQAAAGGMNRYPDSQARVLRQRIAERHDVDIAEVAVGNGSCEILLAAAEVLCELGAEVLFAWPSFSMYPHLAALCGARELRVPLAEGGVHDLEAMLAQVTVATQLAIVCNPNNPTGTHVPASAVADFCERVPDHVTVVLDEAYIEFQTADDPDATVDLRKRFANLVVLRTFSKVYGLAGLRVGYALCAPRFRAAIDAVRQPFSVNSLAQVAAAEAILHQDDVVKRVEGTIVERVWVEEELRALGLQTTETQANFSWISLDERDEREVVEALGRAGVVVRPGAALGAPGHIRVTYGTRSENERFIAALGHVFA